MIFLHMSTSPIQQQWKKKGIQFSRSYFNIEIKYRNGVFAGELKTTAMTESTSLSSAPLLEPKLSTSSTKLNKRKIKKTFRNYDNLTGKNQKDLVCPPELANVLLKFRNLDLGTALHW